MFANWLKRRIQLTTRKAATAELERFVESLRAMSDEEVGAVVASAAIVRVHLRKLGQLPDEVLSLTDAPAQSLIQLDVIRTVRAFQSRAEFEDALGALVWLNTIRALAYPEMRALGRQMWRHLRRGVPHSVEVLRHISGVAPHSDVSFACMFVPKDLDPDAAVGMTPAFPIRSEH